jgi:4Fe-4S ferredoxin
VAAKRLEGAPLIIIDEDKCTFCGLCDSACIFNALEATFDEKPAELEYAQLKGHHVLDEEKCAPCLLCAKICPREALTVDLKVKPKTKLVKYKDPKAASRVAEGNPEAKGTIKILEDKCTWCGLCELLCPECITIYWLEEEDPKPPDFIPAVDIRVDTKHCDYCGLCEEICPSEAIKVTCTSTPPRTVRKPKVEGKLTIDDDKCVDCTLCAQKCPYEALDVTLPLTGRVEIEHLERCDPTGCVNCFNICPTKAIYATGDEQKLAVKEDICVFCGACEHACPEQVLKVIRDSYRLEPLEKIRAWERARASLFFDLLIGQKVPPSNLYNRPVRPQPRPKPATHSASTEHWPSATAVRQEAQNRIRKIQLQLRQDWRLRLKFERGRLGKLSKEKSSEED